MASFIFNKPMGITRFGLLNRSVATSIVSFNMLDAAPKQKTTNMVWIREEEKKRLHKNATIATEIQPNNKLKGRMIFKIKNIFFI